MNKLTLIGTLIFTIGLLGCIHDDTKARKQIIQKLPPFATIDPTYAGQYETPPGNYSMTKNRIIGASTLGSENGLICFDNINDSRFCVLTKDILVQKGTTIIGRDGFKDIFDMGNFSFLMDSDTTLSMVALVNTQGYAIISNNDSERVKIMNVYVSNEIITDPEKIFRDFHNESRVNTPLEAY